MNGAKAVHGFEFDDNSAFDEQVKSETAFQLCSFVNKRNWFLLFKSNSAEGEFMAQAIFVRRFQQARTKQTVHFDCGANDSVGQLVVIH